MADIGALCHFVALLSRFIKSYLFREVIMQALMLFADSNIWSSLPSVDVWFFIICALIVVAIVAVYYLIPVFNKKKYQEQRDNLAKREAAFKANRTDYNGQKTAQSTEQASEKELNNNAES